MQLIQLSVSGAVLCLLTILDARAAEMHATGNFGVNRQGAATYEIPLQFSPGTSGVTPDLSLTYVSSGGSGLLGHGWSLSGIPTIERCAATVARDGGVHGAVKLDKNDRFCLGGSRLVVINGKEYGADGAEYRTEIDSFAKIVSYGVSGDGPNFFKVWTKAGRILEFGNSNSSHIEAQGRNTVRTWALNRNSDAKGNYYDVLYVKNANTGEYFPERIDYTGNSIKPSSPFNSIKFYYEPLPKIGVAYRTGSVIKSTVRISSIKSYAGPDLVSDYRLSYRQEVAWEESRLGLIQRCDGIGSCLPAMSFDWTLRPTVQLQSAAWQTGSGLGTPSIHLPKLIQVDINGDGKTDLVQPTVGNDTCWLTPMIWNGSSFDVGAAVNIGFFSNILLAGDFNGDGKGDLIVVSGQTDDSKTYTLLLSNGTTFTASPNRVTNASYHTKYESLGPIAMDIDGDGRTDIVEVYNDRGNLWVQPLISNGITLVAQQNSILVSRPSAYNYSPSMSIQQGDFDGDGKQDLVVLWRDYNTAVYAMPLLSQGKTLAPGKWLDTEIYVSEYELPYDYVYVMDVNGDATHDLVFVKHQERGGINLTPVFSDGISLIKGATVNGTAGYFDSGTGPYWSSERVVPADINGDGKMDLILGMRCGSATVPKDDRLCMLPIISTGEAFKSLGYYDSGQPYFTTKFTKQDPDGNYFTEILGPGLLFLDFNGDGQTDMVQVKDENDGSPISILPYQSIGGRGSLMKSVDNGLGSITSWTYKPLTDNTVYTKDTGAEASSYPLADLQTPLFVVNEVQTPNGNGGVLRTRYKYAGLKVDMNRRAWTGFRWTESVQLDTGIVQRVFYRQDWPFWGVPRLQQTLLAGKGNNGVLQETNIGYYCTDFVSNTGCVDAPGRRYFVSANYVASQSWDLNSAAFPATVNETEYDTWGNAILKRTTQGGYVTTVRTSFANDTDKWFIGRPLRLEETRMAP